MEAVIAAEMPSSVSRNDTGESTAVTISLANWASKIRADLERIHEEGLKPTTVISIRAAGVATTTSSSIPMPARHHTCAVFEATSRSRSP